MGVHLRLAPTFRTLVSAALTALLATGGVILAAPGVTQASTTVTQTFSYTGSTQTFTVPSGVTSMTVTLRGGQGGRGGPDFPTQNFGGYQGVVTGTIDVTPGQVITVAVGSGGAQGNGGGSALGGAGGLNPLVGYDGAVGGTSGSQGSSGGGGGSGAATVLRIDGVDIVAGGAGGNGGNGQYSVLIGRVAEDRHVSRPDTTSTNGRPGYHTATACGGACDGGASGAGGGGAQGGDRGDVQYGGASATEWFGFGGAPGANSTGGFAGLTTSYAYYSGNSANGSITIEYDNGTPGPPRNLSATAQTGAVALAWQVPASEGASLITDYQVQYATSLGGPWTTVTDGVSTSTSTTVSGLTNGTSYFFRVAAINTQGTGTNATTALATVPSDVPGRPTVTGLVPGGGLVHIDFTAPSSDAPITGYQYRLDGGAWTGATATAGRITVSGLTNGRNYSFEIRALNAIGEGDPSTPAQSATPSDVPEAPTGLQGTGGDGTIDVTWLAPTVDNGAAVTGYVVQRSALPGGPWTTATTTDAVTLAATLTGVTNGTTYRIRIGAVNAQGTGPWSSTVDITPYTIPDTPTFTLAPADGALVATLTSSDGGSDLTLVEYQLDGGAWRSTGTGTSPFTIAGLVNGQEYDVVVRVTNAAGTSPASTIVSGTPAAVPAAPSIAAMALAGGAADVEFTLGADGGSPITNVQYSIDGGDNWITRSPASTASPLAITGLTGGQTYEIAVRAVNAAGHSASSNLSTIRANGVPGTPTVTLTPGDDTLLVGFTTPANGGSPITGYEYSVDGASFVAAPSAESPFLLDGLTNGTEYEVRVRAVNAAGNGQAGTADGTPRTTPTAPTITGNTEADTGGELDVTFTTPTSDGGSAITNYEYSTDLGATWRALSPAATTSPLTITALSSNGTTALSANTEYPVQIRAVNAAGSGVASAAVALSVIPTAPAAPAIDDVVRRDGAVTVDFTPGSNGGDAVIRYEYRLDSGSWVDTGTLATSFQISGIANGAHQVEVRAVNGIGDGAASAAEPFSIFTLPSAPTISTITAGDETLSLAFTAPASDGGSAITGYQYSTDGGVTWRTAASTTSPFSITTESGVGSPTIQNGTLYSVQLRALNAAGSGPASASVLVAPRGAPEAPTAVTTAPVDGGLTVSFTLGADGGSPVTDIEYQLDGGTWVSAGALSSPITITGLTNGQTYGVRIRVVNAIGDGAPSASVNGTPSARPGAPTAVAATGDDGSVSTTWTAPTVDGGSPVTSYVVRAFAAAAGGAPLATCTTSTIGGCDLTGLTNGQTVYVEVAATNAAGTGTASSPRVAVTPLATAEVSIGSIAAAPTELTITASVDDLGGAAITAYEYQLDGGAWVSTGSGAATFSIASLTQGTTYAVRIRAVNAVGTGPASAPVNAVPHTTPGAPVAFAASSAPQSALLTWQVPASNGGQSITDYVVQFATNANGPFTTFADGTSSATSATVTGLTNTTAYVFRVAAVNTAGTGPWSSLAGATPLGAPGAPTIGTITPGSSYLQVAFTAPGDNGGAAVTGYQYRLDGGTWTAASGTTSPITITGLTNGQTYSVQLRAVNSVGGGTASNSVSATPFGLPAGVVGFRATPGASSVTLEWDAVADGGSPISAYNVIRWSGAVAGSILQSYSTTATSLTVTGLGAGTHYFTIEATNAAGTGPRSTPRTTGIVGGTVPSAPTIGTVQVTDGAVSMSWTAGAAGTSAITGYLVQYSINGTTWTTAATVTPASATFTLPSTTTPYTLRVGAVSAVGVSSFTSVALPVVTVGTASEIDSTSATLSGTVDANGTMADVSFEYATSAGALGTLSATLVTAMPSTITGMGMTAVDGLATGLDPGLAHVFRVRATVGGVTVISSNQAFATDALITTSDLDYEYTGSPVSVVSTTSPLGLSLSRTYVGISGTSYPSSSTAPTGVGSYRVTTTPADPSIGGEEIVDITIDPKPMTVTVDAVDRDYDGTDVVQLTFELDGVVSGDDVEADAGRISGSVATPAAGIDRTVTLDVETPATYIVGDDAENYVAALVPGDLEVTISPVSQALTFTSTAPSAAEVGDTYQVTATSNRSLTPVYAISSGSAAVCTIAGDTVTMTGAGTCDVEASQPGNGNVLAAATIIQSFTVSPGSAPDPAIELGLELAVGTEVANAPVDVEGEGLKPFSTVTVEMRSTPIVLGTFVTDANGSFSGRVTLPASVPAGSHRIIVSGEAPDGTPVSETASLFVDWAGSVGWTQPNVGEPGQPPSPSNWYTSVVPTRVLDTRDGAGSPVVGGSTYRLTLPSGLVPSNATAVVINLTVTGSERAGFVSLHPCGSARPWASALNHRAGDTVANLATVSYRSGEALCLYTMSTTHLVVDLAGYYAPGQGDPVTAVSPVRLADTRETVRLTKGTSLTVQVTGAGRAPAGTSAASLYVAVTGPASSGYVTVYPCGGPVPLASNLNFRAGQTIGNSVLAKLATDGTVCIFSSADTDIVVDLNGVASPAAPSRFQPLVAGRVLDTRTTGTPVLAGSTLELDFADVAAGNAVAMNVAAVDPAGDGYVTVYPCGIDRPLVASVNYTAGVTHSNQALVRIGTSGKVCVFSLRDIHLVVDVEGVVLAS